MEFTRRHFLYSSVAAAASALIQTPTQQKPRPPKLPDDAVLEFVKAAHADIEKTQQLLDANPALLNATWDWGGGDFETALGGASHMGRSDIARLLLSRGARIDLFCATMLGMVPAVSSIIEAFPDAVTWKGPHGISLLKHATMGKQDAMAAFLTSKGAS